MSFYIIIYDKYIEINIFDLNFQLKYIILF